MTKEQAFYTKELLKLLGGTVTGVVTAPPEDFAPEGFFGLRVKKNGKEFALWILRDDEGNGPGSFEIAELE